MTTRTIFNRKYESYTPAGTEVYLINGAGVTTTAITTQLLTAGQTLVQGDVVYVSGVYALLASAASGVDATQYNPIGIHRLFGHIQSFYLNFLLHQCLTILGTIFFLLVKVCKFTVSHLADSFGFQRHI